MVGLDVESQATKVNAFTISDLYGIARRCATLKLPGAKQTELVYCRLMERPMDPWYTRREGEPIDPEPILKGYQWPMVRPQPKGKELCGAENRTRPNVTGRRPRYTT